MSRVMHLVAAALVVVWAGVAPAESRRWPLSYTKTTPNGQYVLVMIPPPFPGQRSPWSEAAVNSDRQIRSTYAHSGLYRNDGSNTPLWTIGWCDSRVEPLSDGFHLVRHGGSLGAEGEAVAFFANGSLVGSYAISELMDLSSRMPRTGSGWILWASSLRLLDDAKQYEIWTRHGEHYVFDVTTGEIVRQFRLPRVLLGIAIGLVVVAIVSVCLFRRRRNARRRAAADAAGAAEPCG